MVKKSEKEKQNILEEFKKLTQNEIRAEHLKLKACKDKKLEEINEVFKELTRFKVPKPELPEHLKKKNEEVKKLEEDKSKEEAKKPESSKY